MASGGAAGTETEVARALAHLPPLTPIGQVLDDLQGLGDDGEILGLLRRLSAEHPSPRVRFRADRLIRAAALRVELPTPPAAEVDAVRAALRHRDPLVRRTGVAVARRLPAADARRLLVEAIQRPEGDAWLLASLVAALGEVGGPGVAEEVSVFLDHASPRVAANALLALHRVEPDTAVLAAEYRLESDDNRLRANAILALFPYRPETAWDQVRAMATSPDEWMRASACFLAATLDVAGSERLLVEVLTIEEVPEVIERSLRWLAKAGTGESLGAAAHFAAAGKGAVAEQARVTLLAIRERVQADTDEVRARAQEFRREQEALLAKRRAEQAEVAESEVADSDAAPPEPGGGGGIQLDRELHWTNTLRVRSLVADRLEDALADEALKLCREGQAATAVEKLQRALPSLQSPPPRVRWALAVALLKIGEVGPALHQVEPLDLANLGLAELYALGYGLELHGAVATAVRVFEHIASRSFGYRDVEARLAQLRLRSALVPEEIWRLLAERYTQLAVVGEGGMAQVMRGRERAGGRVVAIKVPDPRLLSDAEAKARFLREIDILSSLVHENIVRVYEVASGPIPYYSMEYVEGRSLRALLDARGSLTAREARALLAPLADAFAYVHSRRIVHRDFKPANVFLDAAGRPRLGDFGIAHLGSDTTLTRTGIALGTMSYMSPEQVAGLPSCPQMDVYAFGLVLFEVITGRLPFPRANPVARLYNAAPRISDLGIEVDPLTESLVARCLELDPTARPVDGADLVEALAEIPPDA